MMRQCLCIKREKCEKAVRDSYVTDEMETLACVLRHVACEGKDTQLFRAATQFLVENTL